jgi:RNA polymerase sigma-70 factor, ECF subfamily
VSDPVDVTVLLQRVAEGGSGDELLAVVYDELRRRAAALMKAENAGHTLQPTALVHEAWFKLVGQREVQWQGRAHFFAIASTVMRRLLVDHARKRRRDKRGGDAKRVPLDDKTPLSVERDEDVLAVHDALERLDGLDPRQAKIVEMRFFGGLQVDEIAELLQVSKRTVESDWTMAKAWLRRELSR